MQDNFAVTVKSVSELLTTESWAWGMYDVLLCENCLTQQSAAVISIAKSYGMKVWIDIDDDKQNVPSYNAAHIVLRTKAAKELDLGAVKQADIVTVSTLAIKDVYGKFNPNIVVVPNAWNDYLFQQPAQLAAQGSIVKVAWRGGDKHSGDLESVREPLIKFFSNSKITWRFYGAFPPPWLRWESRHYVPFQPLFLWWKTLISARPDWLFVPLADNKFNRAKSDCSAIEANMLAGAGVIAPACMPEFNHPGVIRYKDNAHLEDIFNRIVGRQIDKRQVVRDGQSYIASNRRLSELNQKRLGAILKMF